jgi:hypothetical protein
VTGTSNDLLKQGEAYTNVRLQSFELCGPMVVHVWVYPSRNQGIKPAYSPLDQIYLQWGITSIAAVAIARPAALAGVAVGMPIPFLSVEE